jgi:hypothetical protein
MTLNRPFLLLAAALLAAPYANAGTPKHPAAKAAHAAAAPQPMEETTWFSLGDSSVNAPKLALATPARRDTADDITVYARRKANTLQSIDVGDGAYEPGRADSAQSLLPGPQWGGQNNQDFMTALHKAMGIGMGTF